MYPLVLSKRGGGGGSDERECVWSEPAYAHAKVAARAAARAHCVSTHKNKEHSETRPETKTRTDRVEWQPRTSGSALVAAS